MELSVQSNIKQVMPLLERFTSKQAPFAIAMALTSTAKQVQAGVTGALPTSFDRPNAFTRRAFAIVPARKDTLQAIVFAKDKQAKYLKFGVQGGGRRVKAFEKRVGAQSNGDELAGTAKLVPTRNIKRDSSGGVSLATIKRITSLANDGKAGRYFVGQPDGVGRSKGRGAGIYERISKGRMRALMLFVEPKAYKTRLDMPAIGRRIVRENFDSNLRAAWARALATARR